jgi:hypothetical protein
MTQPSLSQSSDTADYSHTETYAEPVSYANEPPQMSDQYPEDIYGQQTYSDEYTADQPYMEDGFPSQMQLNLTHLQHSSQSADYAPYMSLTHTYDPLSEMYFQPMTNYQPVFPALTNPP